MRLKRLSSLPYLLLLIFMISFVGVSCSQERLTNSPIPTPLSDRFTSTIIAALPTPTPNHIQKTATKTLTLQPSTLTPTPGYGSVEVIGYSNEGRPLEVYRFGYGEHVRMLIAGIHGGYEWNTVTLANELMEKLSDNHSLVPQDVTLYILPVLNPDGYAKALGLDGRANANHVDLNRNWDANWQLGEAGAGCWNYRKNTSGANPASEPETQALAKFLLDRQVEALISYHSSGLGIFPGGRPDDQSSISLASALARVGTYSYPPVDTGCEYTGQLIDWASAQGMAAVDVELSNHTDTDLIINLKILQTFLEWQKPN